MNFDNMPELKWIWGYPLSMGVMVLIRRVSFHPLSQSWIGYEHGGIRSDSSTCFAHV